MDPVERQEEMDRMRLHVMKEFDRDNDRMVSFDEFEHGINGTEARNDQGWQVRIENCSRDLGMLNHSSSFLVTRRQYHLFRSRISTFFRKISSSIDGNISGIARYEQTFSLL